MAFGQFFLVYVDAGDPFDNSNRTEVDTVFAFELTQQEGEFAGLELEIKNPKIGILNPTRKQWAYFSFDEGPQLKALLYGRVVGVPGDIQNETLNLSFVAKPEDYYAQKTALAQAMRDAGRPYWDGVWFDPEKRNDPDNVLESRPELWAIDRVTHEVSTSHITNGEDGTLTFTDDEVFYDDMSVSYGEVPLKSAQVTATVAWEMDIELSDAFDISHKFRDPGKDHIRTLTGKGLVDRIPKAGASLGNGWKVREAVCNRIDGQGENVYYVNTSPIKGASDTTDNPFTYRQPNTGKFVTISHTYTDAVKTFVPAYLREWQTVGADEMSQILAIMVWRVLHDFKVEYSTKRKYTETITIKIDADVQDVLTDAGGEDILAFEMSSSEIASPIDPGGELPIGDIRCRTYFGGKRGPQSIEYLIALLRARLLARARCVDITFRVPPMRMINGDISCRMNASFPDTRLPGTTVAGKVKAYKLALDGKTGKLIGEITIGATVGKGGSVVAVEGTPVYGSTDYMGRDYQRFINDVIMPFAGEITYKSIEGNPINDDGVDLITLHKDNIVKSISITPNVQEQIDALLLDEYGNMTGNCDTTPSDVFKRLDGHETTIDLVMVPVTGGPFLTNHPALEVSVLKIQQTINLEAASA